MGGLQSLCGGNLSKYANSCMISEKQEKHVLLLIFRSLYQSVQCGFHSIRDLDHYDRVFLVVKLALISDQVQFLVSRPFAAVFSS